jgi:hypothetical protein
VVPQSQGFAVQGVEPFDCISQNLVSPLHYQSFRYGCKAKQEPVSFMTIQPEGKIWKDPGWSEVEASDVLLELIGLAW